MFWATAARRNCSRTNFNRRRRKRRNPIWFLSSANKASTFFLCRCALANSGVFANSRARCRARFLHVDGTKPERSVRALRLQGTLTATLASPNVSVGPVPQITTTIIQLLPCRTDIAMTFRLISKTLGTIEAAVLPMNTVAGSHVGGNIPIRQPLQKLSVPIGGIGGHRFCLSSLPVREPCDHLLCRHRLLTHACGCGLHADDHATMVVHQIVVVVAEASRRSTLGGVSGIGIGGRHLILLMDGFFHGVLLLQFLQILTQGVMNLGCFRQLLAWNAALLRRIGFHESAIHR